MAPLATMLLQHRQYEFDERGSISTLFFPRSTSCSMTLDRVGVQRLWSQPD